VCVGRTECAFTFRAIALLPKSRPALCTESMARAVAGSPRGLRFRKDFFGYFSRFPGSRLVAGSKERDFLGKKVTQK
jgi:hypothetical protein